MSIEIIVTDTGIQQRKCNPPVKGRYLCHVSEAYILGIINKVITTSKLDYLDWDGEYWVNQYGRLGNQFRVWTTFTA
jgi:hypothetical protein